MDERRQNKAYVEELKRSITIMEKKVNEAAEQHVRCY